MDFYYLSMKEYFFDNTLGGKLMDIQYKKTDQGKFIVAVNRSNKEEPVQNEENTVQVNVEEVNIPPNIAKIIEQLALVKVPENLQECITKLNGGTPTRYHKLEYKGKKLKIDTFCDPGLQPQAFVKDEETGSRVKLNTGDQSPYNAIELMQTLFCADLQRSISKLLLLPQEFQDLVSYKDSNLSIAKRLGKGSFFETYELADQPNLVAKSPQKEFSSFDEALIYLMNSKNLLSSYIPMVNNFNQIISPYKRIHIAKSNYGYRIWCLQEKLNIKEKEQFTQEDKKQYSNLIIQFLKETIRLSEELEKDQIIIPELKYPNVGFTKDGECKICDLSPDRPGLVYFKYIMPKIDAIIESSQLQYKELMAEIQTLYNL